MDEVSEGAAVEHLRAELAMLAEMDRDLGASLELDIVASVLLDYCLRRVAGDAAIVLLEDAARDLSLQVKRGDTAVLAALDGQTIQDLLAPGGAAQPRGDAQDTASTAYLAIPLRFQQRDAGGVVLARSGAAFDEADVASARRLVRHASAAVGNALLYRELAQVNEGRLFFVSKIAHELKTPLAAIQGYSELIYSGMTGEITPKQRKFLASIKRNVTRSTAYIQNLADITRLEAGRLDVFIEPRAFGAIIEEAVRDVRDEYEEKGTRLELDVPTALPPVRGDDFRLVQILTNLLANACAYSPPGSRVTLTVRDQVPDGVRPTDGDLPAEPVIHCAVQDHGYGISAEDQARLFTTFFRSSSPEIRQTPGGGLGLALAKGIVALHGGAIWCDSKLGKGSTFHLVLPQAG
ncbi:MAG: GAF domain-containing sensor histidine kinase [Anaerolineae bacterium]|nr:GAF domain-containing sensor histidine kinase [Anaerolineae bacterium]